jgi:O-antigen ligase
MVSGVHRRGVGRQERASTAARPRTLGTSIRNPKGASLVDCSTVLTIFSLAARGSSRSGTMNALPAQRSRVFSLHRWFDPASDRDQLLVLFLGATLLVRVLTDNLSGLDSQNSGNLNLSGAIAVLLILVAVGLLLRRRKGMLPTVLAVLWLCVWTGVAVNTNGASTVTLREGVREASVIALAVIVYNARGAMNVSIATRLVQLVGVIPALLALYQLATHTGRDIASEFRSYGTFAHPDSAAMFFAIAAAASLWRCLDDGRRRSDALLTALFAAALLTTLSLDGVATLIAMLIVYGALRGGSARGKLIPCAVAILVALTFVATPLGTRRITNESSTSVRTAESGKANSSLAWRLDKWKMLVPEWKRSPFVGQGLGTTITGQRIPGNQFSGEAPHNEYVRCLVETGIVGLAILLWALAILIRRLVSKRGIHGESEADTRNAATLAIVIVIGCLVNSLAENTLLNSPTCYAVVLIVFAVLSPSEIGIGRTPTPRTV